MMCVWYVNASVANVTCECVKCGMINNSGHIEESPLKLIQIINDVIIF